MSLLLIVVDLKYTWFPSPVSFSGLYLHVVNKWSAFVIPVVDVFVVAFSGFLCYNILLCLGRSGHDKMGFPSWYFVVENFQSMWFQECMFLYLPSSVGYPRFLVVYVFHFLFPE